jgi:hypothetical protein
MRVIFLGFSLSYSRSPEVIPLIRTVAEAATLRSLLRGESHGMVFGHGVCAKATTVGVEYALCPLSRSFSGDAAKSHEAREERLKREGQPTGVTAERKDERHANGDAPDGCSKLCRIEQSFKLGGQRAPYSPAAPSDMAFVQPLGGWSRQASNHLVLRFSTSVAESMEVQHLNEMGPIRKPATCQLFRKRFGDCQSVFGGSTFTPEPHSGNSPKSNYQRAIDGLQFSTQDDGGSMPH